MSLIKDRRAIHAPHVHDQHESKSRKLCCDFFFHVKFTCSILLLLNFIFSHIEYGKILCFCQVCSTRHILSSNVMTDSREYHNDDHIQWVIHHFLWTEVALIFAIWTRNFVSDINRSNKGRNARAYNRSVRCLFDFTRLSAFRILDVHIMLYLYSYASGHWRLNRAEWTIPHWPMNHDLSRGIHITRHNTQQWNITEEDHKILYKRYVLNRKVIDRKSENWQCYSRKLWAVVFHGQLVGYAFLLTNGLKVWLNLMCPKCIADRWVIIH
jgi:hypothetical protein